MGEAAGHDGPSVLGGDVREAFIAPDLSVHEPTDTRSLRPRLGGKSTGPFDRGLGTRSVIGTPYLPGSIPRSSRSTPSPAANRAHEGESAFDLVAITAGVALDAIADTSTHRCCAPRVLAPYRCVPQRSAASVRRRHDPARRRQAPPTARPLAAHKRGTSAQTRRELHERLCRPARANPRERRTLFVYLELEAAADHYLRSCGEVRLHAWSLRSAIRGLSSGTSHRRHYRPVHRRGAYAAPAPPSRRRPQNQVDGMAARLLMVFMKLYSTRSSAESSLDCVHEAARAQGALSSRVRSKGAR